MPRLEKSASRPALLFAIPMFACLCVAQNGVSMRPFRAIQPLDSEYLELRPSRERVVMLATLDTPEMEGWQLIEANGLKYVRDSAGKTVKQYPDTLRFRVTAGSRLKVYDKKPLRIEMPIRAEDLKKNLSFRLKRFRGLDSELIEPAAQKMIGVPASVPYSERIYVIEFKLKHVPVDDRFLLEVLDPEGNRLVKFGFFLL